MSHDSISAFWALSQMYSDGLLVENLDRHVMIVNAAFCDMFRLDISPTALRGVDCREAIGHSSALFQDGPASMARIEEIITARTMVRNELLSMIDGRTLERDYLPLTVGGRYRGHMWLYRDVTVRQHRDAEAREEAAMRKAVIESALDGIVIVDDRGAITEFNPAAQQLFGLSATEVVGNDIDTYISTIVSPGIDPFDVPNLLDSSADRFGSRRIEVIGRNVDGVEIPVELSMSAIEVRSEKLYTVFVRDITERNAARLHLERQQRIAYAVAESATWLLNDEDVLPTVERTLVHIATVIGVSRAAVYQHLDNVDNSLGLALFYAGWTTNGPMEPVVGKDWTQEWHEASGRWLSLLREGVPVFGSKSEFPESEHVIFEAFSMQSIAVLPIFIDHELWGILSIDDGNTAYTWTETEVNTLHSLAANIGGAIKRQRLTAALQKSEAELRDRLRDLEVKRQELERATAMIVQQEKIATLGTITSGLAHELNSPLGAILNSAERLLEHDGFDEGQTRNLQLIERAALRSRDVVRKLLMASRPSESSAKRTCNVCEVIRDALDLYGGHMRMQGITLTSTVPDIAMAAIGFSEMSQIVTNLLINARDAVLERTDGADRGIYVSVADGETVSMIIEDNGPGVPDEILPRLYDAFVTTKEHGKGTGLGLWIVRSLLDDANGDITAANTGNGLRITVTLPRPQEGTK